MSSLKVLSISMGDGPGHLVGGDYGVVDGLGDADCAGGVLFLALGEADRDNDAGGPVSLWAGGILFVAFFLHWWHRPVSCSGIAGSPTWICIRLLHFQQF